jgi:hypothetical protein
MRQNSQPNSRLAVLSGCFLIELKRMPEGLASELDSSVLRSRSCMKLCSKPLHFHLSVDCDNTELLLFDPVDPAWIKFG